MNDKSESQMGFNFIILIKRYLISPSTLAYILENLLPFQRWCSVRFSSFLMSVVPSHLLFYSRNQDAIAGSFFSPFIYWSGPTYLDEVCDLAPFHYGWNLANIFFQRIRLSLWFMLRSFHYTVGSCLPKLSISLPYLSFTPLISRRSIFVDKSDSFFDITASPQSLPRECPMYLLPLLKKAKLGWKGFKVILSA